MAGTKKSQDGLTARMPVIAMTQEMYEWIESQADKTRKSRADIVREAIELLKQKVENEG